MSSPITLNVSIDDSQLRRTRTNLTFLQRYLVSELPNDVKIVSEATRDFGKKITPKGTGEPPGGGDKPRDSRFPFGSYHKGWLSEAVKRSQRASGLIPAGFRAGGPVFRKTSRDISKISRVATSFTPGDRITWSSRIIHEANKKNRRSKVIIKTLEYGSRPHIIEATEKSNVKRLGEPVLAFWSRKYKTMQYPSRVHHPGTRNPPKLLTDMETYAHGKINTVIGRNASTYIARI